MKIKRIIFSVRKLKKKNYDNPLIVQIFKIINKLNRKNES